MNIDKIDEKILNIYNTNNDPLDDINFNEIDYINKCFPDESSLMSIDNFINNLSKKYNDLDIEIHNAVRLQAITANDAKKDINDAKLAINELFNKIKDIKNKANQSETMVQEICHDIKRLDSAKRNLTSTKTALTRVSMYLTAVEQLETMVDKRQYREAANLLHAINELSKYFEPYDSKVDKIHELNQRVLRTRDTLTRQIFEDMETINDITTDLIINNNDDDNQFYSDNSSSELLTGACLVADALGNNIFFINNIIYKINYFLNIFQINIYIYIIYL